MKNNLNADFVSLLFQKFHENNRYNGIIIVTRFADGSQALRVTQAGTTRTAGVAARRARPGGVIRVTEP
jgi:hypothetical protein